MRWVVLGPGVLVGVAWMGSASAQETDSPRTHQIVREFPFPEGSSEPAAPTRGAGATEGSRLSGGDSTRDAQAQPARGAPEAPIPDCCPCPSDGPREPETAAFHRAVDHFAHVTHGARIAREQAAFDAEVDRQTRLIAFTRELERERQRELKRQFDADVDRYLRARAFMAELQRHRDSFTRAR